MLRKLPDGNGRTDRLSLKRAHGGWPGSYPTGHLKSSPPTTATTRTSHGTIKRCSCSCIETFGASAPLKQLLKKFGFNVEHIVAAAKSQIAKHRARG